MALASVNSVLRLLIVAVRLATVDLSEAVAVARLAMASAVSCWMSYEAVS